MFWYSSQVISCSSSTSVETKAMHMERRWEARGRVRDIGAWLTAIASTVERINYTIALGFNLQVVDYSKQQPESTE